MPKYFMTWEVNMDKAPADPKERGALWLGMTEMIKQQMKEGTTLDWGCFVGETRGYSIGGQDYIALSNNLQQYFPYITFEVHQVMSIDDVAEVSKSLTG